MVDIGSDAQIILDSYVDRFADYRQKGEYGWLKFILELVLSSQKLHLLIGQGQNPIGR